MMDNMQPTCTKLSCSGTFHRVIDKDIYLCQVMEPFWLQDREPTYFWKHPISFRDLPPELRYIIFQYALKDEKHIHFLQLLKEPRIHLLNPAVIGERFAQEALFNFFQVNHFNIPVATPQRSLLQFPIAGTHVDIRPFLRRITVRLGHSADEDYESISAAGASPRDSRLLRRIDLLRSMPNLKKVFVDLGEMPHMPLIQNAEASSISENTCRQWRES